MLEDYYDVMGVDKNATQSQIKKKYKELVTKWHPDKCKKKKEYSNDFIEHRYKKIVDAYEVLSDPQKREEYDLTQYKKDETAAGSPDFHFSPAN